MEEVEVREELIQIILDGYSKAVNEVNKKGSKLSKDDKLKILLIPIAALSKICLFNNPIPFIDESIKLDHDLDLKNLNYDHSSYFINCPTGILDPATACIYSNTKLSQQRFNKSKKKFKARLMAEIPSLGGNSLMDLYENWLPNLTQKTIKSKDLLDQVLVAYTIKRALNGKDEEAIERLISLYEDTAQAIAIKYFKRIPISIKDKKGDARTLLVFLIRGFSPDSILKELIKDEGNRGVTVLPIWIKNFYIEYLSRYIPRKVTEILGKVDSASERKKILLKLMLNALFNPYSPMVDGLRWRGTPKRINRFKNYSYRPTMMGPHKNLTTWLFGTIKSPWFGKLYQLLKDKYKPKKYKEISFDFRDDFDEDHEGSGLSLEERRKAVAAHEISESRSKSPEECMTELRKIGVSKRDAEIFTRCKVFKEITQSEIASQKGISRRQVIRICQKVNQLI